MALVALLVILGYALVHRHVIGQDELIFFIVLIPSIIVHEVTHGVVALWCGDDTAKQAGRLTLNPIRHIDPIGSVVLPILLIITTHSAFGWAKPVPVRVDRLRHPRNQAVLVSLAAPMVNVLLAVLAAIAFRLFYQPLTVVLPATALAGPVSMTDLALGAQILEIVGVVNLLLAVFNLIPIPPLDGSALVERVLPSNWLAGYYRIRMAFLIVVLFFVFAFQSPLGDVFTWFNQVWLHVAGGGRVLVT